MSDNHSIDADIQAWAEKHSLTISNQAGRRVSSAYLSSIAGECFQIWVEPNADGMIDVHVSYVEGPRDPEPSRKWVVAASGLRDALEEAYAQTLVWMAPSSRIP